ncbi:hypothetical protein QR680_007705 [Steinernema hermaphroditum]|uniref:Uncharacterized protein n=1 Tax=Steinernema hermaphroditum TaxID=289476 RepID=A0AA39M6U2_9BILA|nr:hypothetical protein QR680_007705 [Steinernema hermaphroditum]
MKAVLLFCFVSFFISAQTSLKICPVVSAYKPPLCTPYSEGEDVNDDQEVFEFVEKAIQKEDADDVELNHEGPPDCWISQISSSSAESDQIDEELGKEGNTIVQSDEKGTSEGGDADALGKAPSPQSEGCVTDNQDLDTKCTVLTSCDGAKTETIKICEDDNWTEMTTEEKTDNDVHAQDGVQESGAAEAQKENGSVMWTSGYKREDGKWVLKTCYCHGPKKCETVIDPREDLQSSSSIDHAESEGVHEASNGMTTQDGPHFGSANPEELECTGDDQESGQNTTEDEPEDTSPDQSSEEKITDSSDGGEHKEEGNEKKKEPHDEF